MSGRFQQKLVSFLDHASLPDQHGLGKQVGVPEARVDVGDSVEPPVQVLPFILRKGFVGADPFAREGHGLQHEIIGHHSLEFKAQGFNDL